MISKFCVLFLVLSINYASATTKKDLEEHSVFRIIPANKDQLEFLNDLERRSVTLGLDFWKG